MTSSSPGHELAKGAQDLSGEVASLTVEAALTGRDRRHLETSNRRMAKLLTNARDIVSILDRDGVIRYSTAAEVGALGVSGSDWVGTDPAQLIHPGDRDRLDDLWAAVIANPGDAIDGEVRMLRADGTWADILLTGVNLLDDPDIDGVVLTSRNVTDLRQAERTARSQAEVLELIARGSAAGTIFDRCLDLLPLADSGSSAMIWLAGAGVVRTRSGDDSPTIPTELFHAVGNGVPVTVIDVDAAPWSLDEDDSLRSALRAAGVASAWCVPVAAAGGDRVIAAVGITHDRPRTPTARDLEAADRSANLVSIALERMAIEDRLAEQALHDALTGLPNRTLLIDRLDHALARRRRADEAVAVLFCDLDRFKVVNDSLGHGVGDELLIAVAERIETAVSPDHTVARFGGDEFIILLEGPDAEPEAALAVAEQLNRVVARPFELPEGQEVFLTASIGLALASDHGGAEGWLRDADAAMYRAKERGRNQVVVFDSEMRNAAIERMQVEHDLHRAVDRGELVVHYQPTVDLRSGRIIGAEALVRWNHPTRGLLPPGDFIPVAEETGIVDRIDRDVLEIATGDMVRLLRDHPIEGFQLGVNVSARQLADRSLVREVAEVCAETGWPLDQLLVEVTETALTRELAEPSIDLAIATALGVQFAIDDFGTGHSSLTRLSALPVCQLKMDRSFVSTIGGDERRPIVNAIMALASALDLEVCAEGVETDEQLAYLRRVGCERAQGFLFSAPIGIEEFAALAAADPRW